MGPLNSKPHLEKVLRYINYAVEDGGQVLCGQGVDSCDLPLQNKEVKCTAETSLLIMISIGSFVMNLELYYRIKIRFRGWICIFSLCVCFETQKIGGVNSFYHHFICKQLSTFMFYRWYVLSGLLYEANYHYWSERQLKMHARGNIWSSDMCHTL